MTSPILESASARAIGAATLGEMVMQAAARGDPVALSYPYEGGTAEITYGELVDRTRAIARGLIALGIEPGDPVSILGSTSADWMLCDLGCPHVFRGYYRDEAATASTIDDDGWLHTGDLGSLSRDGYLTITGRKKDLIITSSGKNITPSNIESALRETRWISEGVVYGDDRPYLVAMVTLDRDEAPKLAKQLGVPANAATMATDERVRAAVQSDIDEVNKRFARIEQIKRFAILDRDLSQAGGELTPTLKVKRNVVYGKYSGFFAGIYRES